MIITGIVAGGTGSRMGASDLPKQFMELGNRPLFIYTAEKFLKQSDFIIIGMNKEWLKLAEFMLRKFLPDCHNVFVTEGGSDRNSTVRNIISFAREKLHCQGDDIILTHDAARPFADERMIGDSIAAIQKCDICTAAVPATDTIAVSGDGETADDLPDRSKMYLVQTPQTFRIGDFEEIYSSLSEEEKKTATDVCRLFMARGKKVMLVTGSPENIKITYAQDYHIAKFMAEK